MRHPVGIAMICCMAGGNRRMWNAWSDRYQAEHGDQLDRAGEGWGVWSVPERDLGALGEVAGRRTLEIGCGAARFSAALAARGARCVGLDVSERQLFHARRTAGAVTVVQGSADRLPFADAKKARPIRPGRYDAGMGGSTSTERRLRPWLAFIGATVVAALAWAGMWWVAVPRHDICPAILPAPPGCRTVDRIGTATLWTAIVAVLYLATAALALVRQRGRWWPFAAGLVALAAAGLVGLWAVRFVAG